SCATSSTCADGSALAAAGERSDECSCTSSDAGANGGALSAAFTRFAEGAGENGIVLAADLDGCERDAQLSIAFEFARRLRLGDPGGSFRSPQNHAAAVDDDGLRDRGCYARSGIAVFGADRLIDGYANGGSRWDNNGRRLLLWRG